MRHVSISASSSGDNTLVTVDSAAYTNVYDFEFSAASAVVATLKDANGTVYGVYTFTAANLRAQGMPIHGAMRFCAKGNIVLNLGSAVSVTGHITVAPV